MRENYCTVASARGHDESPETPPPRCPAIPLLALAQPRPVPAPSRERLLARSHVQEHIRLVALLRGREPPWSRSSAQTRIGCDLVLHAEGTDKRHGDHAAVVRWSPARSAHATHAITHGAAHSSRLDERAAT